MTNMRRAASLVVCLGNTPFVLQIITKGIRVSPKLMRSNEKVFCVLEMSTIVLRHIPHPTFPSVHPPATKYSLSGNSKSQEQIFHARFFFSGKSEPELRISVRRPVRVAARAPARAARPTPARSSETWKTYNVEIIL